MLENPVEEMEEAAELEVEAAALDEGAPEEIKEAPQVAPQVLETLVDYPEGREKRAQGLALAKEAIS